MAKAELDLRNAQGFLNGSRNRKESETDSREAAQMAEDARLIAIRRIRADERAAEQAARQKAEADRQAALLAQQQAAEQAKREQEMRTKAEADRQAALLAQQQAQQAADQAAKMRADALAQQQAAQAEAERAKAAAEQSERAREQAETEKSELRERLRQQLNTILETRETQRGLIVNITDVLFAFNQYALKPGAREKLAKVSGILLAYPGLKIQLEGYTDSIGSDEYNMTLSQHRADGVRTYLLSQGVPADTVTAVGMGKANPVADNSTPAGRQQNRRVEMIVSGAPIGIDSGSKP
jgi:outer membrane protein OmpA-like peptidoglycan-associated protein